MNDGKFLFTGTSEELTASMEESVWNCTVPKNEVEHYLRQYLVANVKTLSQSAELRILSGHPPTENAIRDEASLEDAFLLYFGEKGDDTIDTEV